MYATKPKLVESVEEVKKWSESNRERKDNHSNDGADLSAKAEGHLGTLNTLHYQIKGFLVVPRREAQRVQGRQQTK
jgi:hypothetical protein